MIHLTELPSGISSLKNLNKLCLIVCLAVLSVVTVVTPAVSAGAPVPAKEKSLSTLKREIQKAVRAKKDASVLSIARKIAARGGDDAAKILFDVGMKAVSPKQFKGIAKILATMLKDEEVRKYLAKKSNGSKTAEIIYIADIAAEAKSEHAIALLANMTDTKDPRVLRTVIPALRKLRKKECIPPLLSLLERFIKSREHTLITHEIRAALWDLTGQDFDVMGDWTKWWETVKDNFNPDQKNEGKTYVSRSKDAPEFAGKKILSKNALFVIDSSGTMRYVMKDDIPGLGVGDGTDSGNVQGGGKMTPEDERLARWWTRLEMAKRELLKALKKFGAGTRFNVVEFNKIVKSLEKKLVRATPKAKKKAVGWVKRMKFVTIPGTNTQKALTTAISTPGVAEIFFLSDGLPSADGKKNDDPMPILDHVESMNRFRKVKIHTFGYDPVPFSQRGQVSAEDVQNELAKANAFLKLLAERTGGTFHLLTVDPKLAPPADFKSRCF